MISNANMRDAGANNFNGRVSEYYIQLRLNTTEYKQGRDKTLKLNC